MTFIPANVLQEKMRQWEEHALALSKLEEEIKTIVLKLQATQQVGMVAAMYSKGRGSYNWEALAHRLEPDEDLVVRYSETVIDWKGLCEHIGAPSELKKKFYTPGSPYVTLKLSYTTPKN